MTGSVENELHTYIDQLNSSQKRTLLDFMKSIFPVGKNETVSIEQYNKELETADAAIEQGKFLTQEQVMKKAKIKINARK